MKTFSEPMQRIYTRVYLLGCFHINSLHSLFFTSLIELRWFFLSNSNKKYYRLFEFLSDTLVKIQPEVLNIGTFKMFKTEVL